MCIGKATLTIYKFKNLQRFSLPVSQLLKPILVHLLVLRKHILLRRQKHPPLTKGSARLLLSIRLAGIAVKEAKVVRAKQQRKDEVAVSPSILSIRATTHLVHAPLVNRHTIRKRGATRDRIECHYRAHTEHPSFPNLRHHCYKDQFSAQSALIHWI